MARLDDLLAIVWLLRANHKLTAAQLAEKLEISVRTVYRYIDTLCASGVPVVSESGHGGGYSLPRAFLELPLFFDTTELKAMAHSARFARLADYPHAEALERALAKITRRLAESQLDELSRQASGIEVADYARGQPLYDLLLRLEEASIRSQTVILHYRKAGESEGTMRRVDPYGLIYRQNRWYLAGYCHNRKALRVFRADRIEAVTLTEESFLKPESFSAQDFIAGGQAEGGSAPVQPEARVTVRLKGREEVLDPICNQWFLRPCLAERRDGTAVFRMDPDLMLALCPPSCFPSAKPSMCWNRRN